MSKAYDELLRDPRWQRKRLEVMQGDHFACRFCRDGSKTLSVHHTYYRRGTAPWEYPTESLVTLCEDCHLRSERDRLALLHLVGVASAHGLADEVLAYLRARIALVSSAPDAIQIRSNLDANGVAAALWKTPQFVADWAHANGGSIDPVAVENGEIEEWLRSLESGDGAGGACST